MDTTNPPTSRRLAITPGDVMHDRYCDLIGADGSLIANVYAGGEENAVSPTYNLAEARANATLYADAHNTANACQMLPSELLAKLRDAEEELRNIAEAKRYNNRHFENDTEFASWAISRAAFRIDKLNLPK